MTHHIHTIYLHCTFVPQFAGFKTTRILRHFNRKRALNFTAVAAMELVRIQTCAQINIARIACMETESGSERKAAVQLSALRLERSHKVPVSTRGEMIDSKNRASVVHEEMDF